MITPKKKFMELAIKEAKSSRQHGDYAVGAILVKGNKIIARGSNRSKRDESPIAHAETLAVLKGCKIFKQRHLKDCVLYCTHEPCPMCSSVIVWSRLKAVIYGTTYGDMKNYRKNIKNNDLWRTINISCQYIFNKSTSKVEVVSNFMRKECLKLFHSEFNNLNK